MPRAALWGFMAAHYVPDRMVLVGAGAVEHERLVELGERWFGDRPGGRAPPPEPARYCGGARLEARELEQVHLCLGLEGVSSHDPDYWAVQVLAGALGGGMSSRLFQEARENRGLCYAIDAVAASYADTGLLSIYAGTGADRVAELLEVVAEQVRGLARTPEPAEIDRAKAQLKAGLLMSLESCAAVADGIARQLLVHGRTIPVDEMLAAIEAVDEEAIRRVGERLFGRGSPTTSAAIGELDALPSLDLGRIAA
jgi:predicted Zn-dependent peptidase